MEVQKPKAKKPKAKGMCLHFVASSAALCSSFETNWISCSNTAVTATFANQCYVAEICVQHCCAHAALPHVPRLFFVVTDAVYVGMLLIVIGVLLQARPKLLQRCHMTTCKLQCQLMAPVMYQHLVTMCRMQLQPTKLNNVMMMRMTLHSCQLTPVSLPQA